ncbi:MAG TPA: TPM domain-containing protein, partial [Candidatus Binatia bacterium]|nr:TPM domain-containing protein [Candidatus Binatia bacterium]
MPEPSYQDLEKRMKRFKARSGHSVVVITLQSLEGEDPESFGERAFQSLPLGEPDLKKTILLIVARKEHAVGLQTGMELKELFPEPTAREKLQKHVDLYFSGMRPDLGIHSAVFFVFRTIRGEVKMDGATEFEKLEEASTQGTEAGPIFAIFLAPFLAFFIGALWGICSTNYGVQTAVRLTIGAVLGGGTAKVVAGLMELMGAVSDGLWYFILILSIALATFGSLTEFWMAGDWRGIPRLKDPIARKPEDKMGI